MGIEELERVRLRSRKEIFFLDKRSREIDMRFGEDPA